MENIEAFLQQAQDGLAEILKPFQRLLDQQQRMADFVGRCIRGAAQDNFIELDELLKTRLAEAVEADDNLKGCKEIFARLRTYADDKVERYRLLFIEAILARAQDVGLPLEVDFPRLISMKGIEAAVDFGNRTTTINKKTLKSIDPKRIVSALLKEKRELYDRPFDARSFIDDMHRIYREILKKDGLPAESTVPVQRFYFEYVMSLQSKTFFQDMAKGRFRGYTLDQLAVDIWRYFKAGTYGTSEGYGLKLRPGRNNSLWLIDSDGEKRQITGISFLRGES